MNYYNSVNYYYDTLSQYYYDNFYHNYHNLSLKTKCIIQIYIKIIIILYTTLFDSNRSNIVIHQKLTAFFILIPAPPFTSRATVSL